MTPAAGERGPDLVVFGTGSYPRTVRRYFERDTPHRVVAFTVDDDYAEGGAFDGLPLVPFSELRERHPPAAVTLFVALGYRRVNRLRAEVFTRCRALGYSFASYVSPRAIVADGWRAGANCFVFEAVVLGGDVALGDDVVVWSGAHLAHDARIGDHCFIAPCAALAGNVTVGSESFIGTNATIRDGVTIAPRSVIGAGAVILRDTAAGGVYRAAGTPPLADVTSADLMSL